MQIDQCIELMYEDMPEALRILKQTDPYLVSENSLIMSALSRTLIDDAKSVDLCAQVMDIFKTISANDPQAITKYRIGTQCMRTLDFELHRSQLLLTTKTQKNQVVLVSSCIQILLNLRNLSLAKMIDKNIVGLLLMVLKTFPKLESQVVHFLTHLSTISMAIPYFVLLEPLFTVHALKVLINLSHSAACRAEMLKSGLCAMLVEVDTPESTMLLYQLSTEDQGKSILSYTDMATNLCKKLLLNYSQETAALAINLSLNVTNAESMVPFAIKILHKAISKSDTVLFKLIYNMATHDEIAMKLEHLVPDLICCLSKNMHITTQVIGILSLIEPISLETKQKVIDYIKKTHLQDDEFLVQCVLFMRRTEIDGDLIEMLLDCLSSENEYLVFQAIETLSLHMENTLVRQKLLKSEVFLRELGGDGAYEAKEYAKNCVVMYEEFSDWSTKLKAKCFCEFNAEWLKHIN